MDTLHTPAPKTRPVAQQAVFDKPQIANLDNPIMKADATVQHCTTTLKCGPVRRYYAGMVKR